MAPTGKAYNVDWALASSSNVHVANHRDWFTAYTPFSSRVFDAYGMDKEGIEVVGIGDVKLPVEKNATKTGPSNQGFLVLRDLLHVPKYACKVFGKVQMEGITTIIRFAGPGLVVNTETGAQLAVVDNPNLSRLRLTGQNAHQTSLDKDSHWMINAYWPDKEQERWFALKNQASANTSETNAGMATQKNIPPYTAEERRWLRENIGNEYHFLRGHQLSIYKEDDRAEGRLIVRAVMKGIEEAEEQEDESDVEDEEGADDRSSFERDLEENPESHFADHHFTANQLAWIKKHFEHSSNFLTSYGLKCYNDEDCKEGVAIVKEFMKDDTEDNSEQNGGLRIVGEVMGLEAVRLG